MKLLNDVIKELQSTNKKILLITLFFVVIPLCFLVNWIYKEATNIGIKRPIEIESKIEQTVENITETTQHIKERVHNLGDIPEKAYKKADEEVKKINEEINSEIFTSEEVLDNLNFELNDYLSNYKHK